MNPNKKAINVYYHNAEYGINISYLGHYDYAYAALPVGWRPTLYEAFEEAYAWNRSDIGTLPSYMRRWFQPFDDVLVNVGLWWNKVSGRPYHL